jgi:hypothetical protein
LFNPFHNEHLGLNANSQPQIIPNHTTLTEAQQAVALDTISYHSGHLSFLTRQLRSKIHIHLVVPATSPSIANLASTGSSTAAPSHQRRRSSIASRAPPKIITTNINTPASAQSSGNLSSRFEQSLDTVPGTPGGLDHMSLSRSPSPQRSGGWSSPGLTTPYNSSSRRSSPIRSYANGGANNVTWATAQARSDQVRSFSPRNQGFSRYFQGVTSRLPYFNSRNFSDKEKLGRGRWSSSAAGSRVHNLMAFLGRVIWRMRLRFAAVLAFLLLIVLFYITRGYFDVMIVEHRTDYSQLFIEYIERSPTWAAEKSLS